MSNQQKSLHLFRTTSLAYRDGRARIAPEASPETISDPLATYLRSELLRLGRHVGFNDSVEDLIFRLEVALERSIEELKGVRDTLRDRRGVEPAA